MRTLILKTLVCGAALLPFSQAHAAGPAGKLFGGFAPGKTFTFKVTERVSGKVEGTKVTKNVPVPAGIPDYKKGQKVKFTIGKKGELTAPGLSLPFKSDAGTANAYATLPTASNPRANVGQVFKTTANKPVSAALTFFKVSIKGFTATTNTVVYTLE